MSNSTPFLSVIIPSYNETKSIRRGVLNEVYDFLKQQEFSFEIVLSDDGSTDGTIDELRKFSEKRPEVRLIENHHAGKGPTVASGMLAAWGRYRLFTDFDQSTPISEVIRALAIAQTGVDIVIGSREGDTAKREKEPVLRHVMGRVFNILVQILALRGIQDSQCGFKLFTDRATLQLFSALVIYGGQHPRQDAFTGAFDVELLFLARKWKFKVAEMPVEWKHYHSDRVSPVKDSLRMLRDILRIRWAWLTQQYK